MGDRNTLNTEVMDNIVPFSGTREEMTPAQQIMADGGAIQKTQTTYTTAVAVQKPRSIARVVANVLEEAKLAGTAFYYRWEVWDKQKGRKVPIQGPSIDLAMCLARNYGNCAIDVAMTETLTHYIFKGVFIDLETGFTVPRLFRQRKAQNIGGKMDKDRAEDLVFQIGQSKAQRNAIIKAAPGWLVEQAVEEARQAEIDKINPENMAITRAKVLDFFGKYAITQERIEKYIGRNADTWTAEDVVNLKASATALKEGRVSADEIFPEDQKEPETPREEANALAGQEQGAEDSLLKGIGDEYLKHDGSGPPVSDAEPSYFEREFKGLKASFPGKVKNHIQTGKIKEATPPDKKALRHKWWHDESTRGMPLPEELAEGYGDPNFTGIEGDPAVPVETETDPLKIKLKCPENSPTFGDEMHILYCQKVCNWPEKTTQCKPFIDAGEDVAF